MDKKWFVLVSPLTDEGADLLTVREDTISDFPYRWGPFSSEDDARMAVSILATTYLGDDLKSVVVEEEAVEETTM